MAKRSSMRDRAKERAETRQQTGGGGTKFIFPEGTEVKFFQPKKGTMHLDLIPYEVTIDHHPAGVKKGDLWYQRTIWVHYGIGAEEKSYLCLKTSGKRCPICEARAQMIKDGDADEKVTDALKSKEREIFNVIDLDDEKEGVQLWEMSYHLFGKKLEEEVREGSDEDAGFAELVDGRTLKVRFQPKKMGKTEFLEATRIDFEERDDYEDDVLDDVLNLDEILNVLPADKLEALFLELEEDEEKPARKKKDEEPPSRDRKSRKEKDEEEEKPSRRSRKSEPEDEEEEKPSRRSRRDKEPEDEEEEKPSRRSRRDKEPEDEPEKPSRRSRRDAEEEPEEKPSRRSRKSEPEDEEEEKPSRRSRKSEPEDEEEEKPSRRSRGKEKDEEEEKPSRRTRGKDEAEKPSKNKCPAGGKFGVDCDELEGCFDCPEDTWNACKEEQESGSSKKGKR